MLLIAAELLRSRVPEDVRTVAKACIDEADEIKRFIQEHKSKAPKMQLQTLSPPRMIEKAKSLVNVVLGDKALEEKARQLAASYVEIAEENQKRYDQVMEQLRKQLPPGTQLPPPPT
jgi:hypothetical protein